MSQLVMRSFDVADKGEVNKGDGPLEKRGERTPGHNHSKEEGKGGEKRAEKCGWRQEAAPRQDRKGSSQLLTKPPPRP